MKLRKKPKQTNNAPQLHVRAYCSKCGKLLMESPAMTKRQLLASWDDAVLHAPGIPCKSCNTKIPNFEINLKIYHKTYNREWLPEEILPTPSNPVDVEKLAKESTLKDVLNSVENDSNR